MVTRIPASIRNNNPGNIVRTGIDWENEIGPVGNQSKKFESFATAEDGVTAMARLLRTYTLNGHDTIREIITRWAPPHENNTAEYIQFVSKAVGVKPDAKIDSTDFDTMFSMVKAMIRREGGKDATDYYNNNIIAAGISEAINAPIPRVYNGQKLDGSMPAYFGTDPRTALGTNIYHLAQRYDHVRYKFGSDNVTGGTVDCSGFSDFCTRVASKAVFGRDFPVEMGMSASEQFRALERKNPEATFAVLSSNKNLASLLKPGMIIYSDNGKTRFDAGRYKGIDHVEMVAMDKNGQLCIVESSGSKGVHTTPMADWLRQMGRRNIRLYGFDTGPLFGASEMVQTMQTTTAAELNGWKSLEDKQQFILGAMLASTNAMKMTVRDDGLINVNGKLFRIELDGVAGSNTSKIGAADKWGVQTIHVDPAMSKNWATYSVATHLARATGHDEQTVRLAMAGKNPDLQGHLVKIGEAKVVGAKNNSNPDADRITMQRQGAKPAGFVSNKANPDFDANKALGDAYNKVADRPVYPGANTKIGDIFSLTPQKGKVLLAVDGQSLGSAAEEASQVSMVRVVPGASLQNDIIARALKIVEARSEHLINTAAVSATPADVISNVVKFPTAAP